VAFLKWGLRRRGFQVIAPGEGYPPGSPDWLVSRIAEATGCPIVTLDRDFEGDPRAVVIPHAWLERYNSWELVTKVVKTVYERRQASCGSSHACV
jgi:hypothetical protein